jgi:hypothetical protein
MLRACVILCALLTGCSSHTAQIAASANDARAEVGAARGHIQAAMGSLDRIEQAAARVHEQVGYVSDDEPAFVAALKYGSFIAGAAAVLGIVYLIKSKT